MSEFDLLEHAKRHARQCVEDLEEPEEDIMPVLLWMGPYGMGIMPLLDMHDTEAKDDLAAMMTTSLAVSRATEAVMVTTAWMVQQPVPEGAPGVMDVPPSEHPNRVETVALMYSNVEDKDSMTSATVIRHPDRKPDLGEWGGHEADSRLGGRFGDAVHLGLDFSQNMPEELVEILDEGWRDGEQDQLITRFHRVFSGFMGVAEGPGVKTVRLGGDQL